MARVSVGKGSSPDEREGERPKLSGRTRDRRLPLAKLVPNRDNGIMPYAHRVATRHRRRFSFPGSSARHSSRRR